MKKAGSLRYGTAVLPGSGLELVKSWKISSPHEQETVRMDSFFNNLLRATRPILIVIPDDPVQKKPCSFVALVTFE